MARTIEVLDDRYELGEFVGSGGMSELHRGRDLRLGRDVAIKVLRADLARDPSFQARFRREAQNAASLNHPAIVAVYDTGETQGESGTIPSIVIPYIVMEYVDGDTLRDVLKKEGPLPPQRAMEIVADVCAALDFSHRHGIVHRDIKPANVMLNRAGAVKVMDFGIARAVSDGQATMTATAAVIGTAHYLSPEQARGEAVDARSDVYATGCVLYELLCGQPPFTGDSPVAIAYQHVREAPKPPSETTPGLPTEMDGIVLKALNKNPLNRYQTAAEMRSDLVRALSGPELRPTSSVHVSVPHTAREDGASPPLLAPISRADEDWEPETDRSKKVWGFILIGLLCLVLVGAVGWLTLSVVNAPPPAALVAVPDLTGQSLEQATATLREKGLTPGSVTEIDSADDMIGKVVGQRPSHHTQVGERSQIAFEIGTGVRATSVPAVIGMTPAAAKDALAAAQLGYAEQRQPSSDADRGKVIAQEPAPGVQAAPSNTVTATIGTGMSLVAVPDDIVGKTIDEATSILQAARLTVVTEEGDGVEPVNVVIAMDQGPGQQVPEGTPVTLTASNNSLMVMPNLQNRTQEYAVAALLAQGWAGNRGTLKVAPQPTANPAQVGAVLAQQPAAGSTVRKTGTPITLTVAVGSRLTVVPDLVGTTARQAATLLERAGFTRVTFVDAGPPPRGLASRVQGQSIQPNTAVPVDTPITVGIYRG